MENKTTIKVNLCPCLVSIGNRVILFGMGQKDKMFWFRIDARADSDQLLINRNDLIPAIYSIRMENLDFIPSNRLSSNEHDAEYSLKKMNQYLNDWI